MKKLENIKGLLSREEMRNIQGGSGSGCATMFQHCEWTLGCCGGLTCMYMTPNRNACL